MIEISASNINKYFGDYHLLQNLSFELLTGERVSIVGPNGCGKTTLLKIISGLEGYDSGDLVIARGRQVGLLEQLPDYGGDMTVRDVLWKAFEHIEDMGRQMRQLEQDMAGGKTVDMALYSRLQTAFEDQGGYDLNVPYARMTNGLKIDGDMQDRPFMSLSGGEKTRVNLARLMLTGTDILLLDEPTNHLDLQSIQWLEEYLRAFKGTVLMVSHDRYFLDRASTRTLELTEGAITSWPGNYSYYVDKKQELMEQLEAAKKRQDKEIARLSFTVDRMKGWGLGNKKVMKRAFAMEKRIERIERVKTIRREHKMRGQFTVAGQSGEDVYSFMDLNAGYDKPLVRDFSATVFRGERIAILGPNGAGKTTLLQTILRQMDPLSGRIYEGVGVKKGYLPQTVQFDNPHRTLVDTILYETRASTQEARDRLAAFEFKGEDVFKTVNVLSGGEKTRLKLCVFMYSQVNTLFLDEPTNHLDILSREWVEDAIDEFSETMLFISHDRYFINRFATRIWELEDGEITDFIGPYEEYVESRERAAAAPVKKEAAPKPPRPKVGQAALREQEKRKKELARQVNALEKQLDGLEAEMTACPAEEYTRLSQLYEEKEGLEAQLLTLYEEVEACES